MAKVITFSTKFPDYHQKAGKPTFFVEKFVKSMDPNMSADTMEKTMKKFIGTP